MKTCTRCGKALREVFPGHDCPDQLDNALTLVVDGGYGEFIDNLDYLLGRERRPPTFVLCHECGHEFCDWADPERKIIDPATAHGHHRS